MRQLLTFMTVLLVAAMAQAVDPECVDPVAYDEAVHGQYDATVAVHFCTPQRDVGGFDLVDGDLTSCTVTAGGQPFALTSTTRAGAFVTFATPDSVKQAARFGAVEVYCSNAAGDGAPVVASNARFRDAGIPGSPALLP